MADPAARFSVQGEFMNSNDGRAATSRRFRIAVVLALTIAIGPFAVDTYLPAFPVLAVDLGVSVHEVSLSIAMYVFMLALGQLVAGPLSDRLGRQVVMLAGMGVFAVASAFIATIDSLAGLLGWRMVQAFGGGAATVCVPALVRDHMSGQSAAKFFSLIGLVMIIAPAIAPTLGTLLLAGFGWPSIFVFTSLYALVVIVLLRRVVFRHIEPRHGAHATKISVWRRYVFVLSTRPALRYIALQSLSFTILMLFVTHASFIYQGHFGASAALFALLFAANVLVMMVLNLANRWLLHRFESVRVLRWAVSLQAGGIVLMGFMLWWAPGLWTLVPGVMVTVGAMGAISPNNQACYMDYFHLHGGTAAALMGAAQFAIGGLIGGASSLLPESVAAVIAMQGGCALVCLALVWTRGARAA